MASTTIHPENYGKKAVLQIIESREIIKTAQNEARRILESIETEKTKTLKVAYNKGLLLGAKRANRSLKDSTQLNTFLKAKIENLIIDLTKQILIEIVREDVGDILKNAISHRVTKELEEYSKQVNFDDTKISLDISSDVEESEIEKILVNFPFLHICKNDQIESNKFILKSPYGEIESDPICYIELAGNHLRNSLDLSLSEFINE